MYPYVSRMYPYVTRMLVVCIRMYPYVPYVTRMLPVSYPYVLVWCFSLGSISAALSSPVFVPRFPNSGWKSSLVLVTDLSNALY